MIEQIATWLRESTSVVALTGAGISTESGIPDFRGPNGVWTKDPAAEKMATLQYYMSDPSIRVKAWQWRCDNPTLAAEPNAGHDAFAALDRAGRLDLLVTQNVDGLHQKAGLSQEKIVEIHGTMRDVVCMSCGQHAPMERALARVRAGEQDPPCGTCGGILKSATISFGQSLVEDDLMRAERAARTCDLFLAVGTSLVVYPVAALVAVALENGARLVIINAEETPYDNVAHAVLREKIGQVLPAIVAAL